MTARTPPRRPGPDRLAPAARWTIAAVVLALAGVAATWPLILGRSTAPPAASSPAAGPSAGDRRADGSPAEVDLPPCPEPTPGGPAAGPLAGVVVRCLGRDEPLDLGLALAGRPALVNLWASWCAPCREEIPALSEYAGRPGAIDVVGANVRDDTESALALLAELRPAYPSVVEIGTGLREVVGGPPVLPVSVVVRPDGSLIRLPPTVLRSADDVRRAVEGALEQS